LLEEFVSAIHAKRQVQLAFFSKEDGTVISRRCAPMDYGPSRRAKLKQDRYHVWDYESDEKNHVLSLDPDKIVSLQVLDATFDPAEFVSWDTSRSAWFVPRQWGEFS